jgi:hypothetical protein
MQSPNLQSLPCVLLQTAAMPIVIVVFYRYEQTPETLMNVSGVSRCDRGGFQRLVLKQGISESE